MVSQKSGHATFKLIKLEVMGELVCIEELLKADSVSALGIEVEQSITANAEGEPRIATVHFMPPSAPKGLN